MMRYLATLTFGLSFFLTACGQIVDMDTKLSAILEFDVDTMLVEELRSRMDSNEVVVLDAREKKEYEVSKIPGAHHIGYNNFKKSNVKDFPRDTMIVVYCSIGYRSEIVARKMEKMGFENVHNLYGGIFEWKNNGNEVEGEDGEATEKVHTYDQFWAPLLEKGEAVYE